jgi:hypothetical protein
MMAPQNKRERIKVFCHLRLILAAVFPEGIYENLRFLDLSLILGRSLQCCQNIDLVERYWPEECSLFIHKPSYETHKMGKAQARPLFNIETIVSKDQNLNSTSASTL